MKKHIRNIFAVLGFALFAIAPCAQADISFATGSAYYTGLGLEVGYPSDYDHLTITGTSGIYSAPGTYTISSLLFQSAYNAWNIHTDTGALSFAFTVGSTTQTMVVPYSIFISYSDTITLLPGSLNFDIGGGQQLTVTTQSLVLPDTVGTANLQGTFSISPIPEPETYAMLLAGFGPLAFAIRRRRLKQAAAT
jgi:PEP-CTERM motif